MLAVGVWGSFPQWLAVLLLVLAAATFVRGSRSVAITNLRTERDELERECLRLSAENAALRATRDLAPVQQAILDALHHHEAESRVRAQKMLDALDRHLNLTELVAERLGPEPAT